MVKKRKEDFVNYITSILKNSMLTGIPQIASAGNWPKRIVRTLIFFVCMAGFIYQSMSFMQIYWEYEVVMDVKVENPKFMERPSFTGCNKIGFKVQDFCGNLDDPEIAKIAKENEAYCHKVEQKEYYMNWCECIPRFCDAYGNLKNMSTLNMDSVDKLPFEIKKKWLLTAKEILPICYEVRMTKITEKFCNDNYFLQIPCPYYSGYPESCVTVNSLIGRPNHTLEKVSTGAEIELMFHLREDNYTENVLNPVKAFSIHNPYSIVNPFVDGYMIQRDRLYSVRLKKVVKHLLPPPYTTNCMDYRSLWHARGGYGPTNLKECMQECAKNMSMEILGCIYVGVFYPTTDIRCNVDDNIKEKDEEKFLAATRECSDKNCRPACFEEYYEPDFVTWQDVSVRCSKQAHEKGQDAAIVYIVFNGLETTTYTYTPKFNTIETFSYLGGYVGMWLGISLLAVFDFVETIAAMLKYPLRRWGRYREKQRKINEIQQFQRKL